MANKTTNYGFDTPGLDGAANIEVQDSNWEKADAALAEKMDKTEGKGLSANDYTDAEKAEVATIKDKVDKVSGKGLSANDFTNTYKSKLDNLDTNLSAKAAKTEVLTKTNTTAFTPTANYQPATKKYVDDAAAQKAPMYSYGTADLTAGTSALATGKLYFVYE